MISRRPATRLFLALLCLLLCGGGPAALAQAAAPLTVDLTPLEGLELTPANAFSYRILNGGGPRPVRVTATVRFRNSPLRLWCTYDLRLEPGANTVSAERTGGAVWMASEEALRSLFVTYGRLPQGTYEYCVSVSPKGSGSEQAEPEPVEACTYHTVEDLFAINLIDPEDKALLYERYPTFSWSVNYPFASELTYRIRVAEQKAGQNAANAMGRNNAVWQERGVLATTATYPLSGRPLEVGQPYVWTVDAFYHGLLLGGAETWRFMLVEDTLNEVVTPQQSYYEFQTHFGDTRIYVAEVLKLFYNNDLGGNSLEYTISNNANSNLETSRISVQPGGNYIEIPLSGNLTLAHRKRYQATVKTKDGKSFVIPFIYLNPDFLK